MRFSFRLLIAAVMLWAFTPAQAQTTTITGTIRDLSNALVTSGQVTFESLPPNATSISGTARFTRSTVTCTINGSGLVKALDGVSACTLLTTTATSPGAGYKACILPAFADEGNCFNLVALGASLDISTVVFTPTTSPIQVFVDTFSTQTITGSKTFSGAVTFGGSVSLGSVALSGTLTANNGGSLGGTFSGNPTLSGNVAIGGTLGVTAAVTGPSFGSTAANPATSGFLRLARTDTECWKNFVNAANVCLSNPGAASAATGNLADNLLWGGGGFQAAAFVDNGTPAQSGVLRTSNNVCAVASRNALASGDVCAVQVNASNQTVIASGLLASPAISDPTITGNTAVKRVKATQGTALVTGDVGTLTGWGTTATVGAVLGTDGAGSITIASAGTGQTINPTFVLTFHDGTWTNSPIVVVSRTDVSGPAANWQITSTTATAVTFQFNNGTPSAGANYSLNFIAIGR